MPWTAEDWAKVNSGKWLGRPVIPANKAWLVKDSLNGADANRVGSAAGSARGRDGSQFLIFLAVWPETSIEKLMDRMKYIAFNLANSPPRSREELVKQMFDKAHLMQENHTVEFKTDTMTPANIAFIEAQNANMTSGKPWRLDLARNIEGDITYQYLPFTFKPGVTGIMTQDEIITIWMLIKSQLMAALLAKERSRI